MLLLKSECSLSSPTTTTLHLLLLSEGERTKKLYIWRLGPMLSSTSDLGMADRHGPLVGRLKPFGVTPWQVSPPM